MTAIVSAGCREALQIGGPLLAAGLTNVHLKGGARSRPPVDRQMTMCEMDRGRFREAHQDRDEPPPELRCLDDGSYPDHPQHPLPPSPAPSAPPPKAP